MKSLFFFLLFTSGLGAIHLRAQQTTPFHILKTFHINSAGGWDYLAVGPRADRLYVSHGTQVNILDKTSGDSLGVIENTSGVHGIAFDQGNGKGYTSNGQLNNVTVFDLDNNKTITQIPTGKNPDAIMLEPFSGMIVTCNGKSNDLSVIDPAQNKVIATIPVGGKPETAVSDEAGKLFVNIEDRSEIAEINMNNYTVVHRWSIAPGEEPSGLAIDKKTNRLFAGCSNKLLIVVNALNGKVLNTLAIGDGCDGVAFDEDSRNIYSSNGEGSLTVIHEKNAGSFEQVATVVTKKGARTLAVDQSTHLIYLPTAEFEQNPPLAKGRPKMIPGTFQVLVIGH